MTPSNELIELLKVTGSLFLNLSIASPLFKKLTPSDFELIFSILSKPNTWEEMTNKDKIIFITRFENGRIIRENLAI